MRTPRFSLCNVVLQSLSSVLKHQWPARPMLPRICHLKALRGTNFGMRFKVPVAFASSCKTKVSQSGDTSGKRDLVNFPRPTRLENTPPHVLGFLPKSWFAFFYSKTGVTGGYTLFVSLSVYLFSKEIIVCDVEFITFFSVVTLCTLIQRNVPEIAEMVEKDRQETVKEMDSQQENAKKEIRNYIEELEKNKWGAEGIISMLPEAKRENVYLQMEAAYRGYLKEAHLAVLNILNYNVEKSNIELFFIRKHLVNWLLNIVPASVSPDIKKVALEKAISDLKLIAAGGGG